MSISFFALLLLIILVIFNAEFDISSTSYALSDSGIRRFLLMTLFAPPLRRAIFFIYIYILLRWLRDNYRHDSPFPDILFQGHTLPILLYIRHGP